jgi:2-polyprenyl-3-methyl-5-hydroxy-6-metoxy-1,4-benzoquinol methylase
VDTDRAWKRFGEVDPYYGVLTEAEYRTDKLTEQGRYNFFQSGEQHVIKVLSILHEISPTFSPARSLDFGCGVGRVAIPLARRSTSVLGVDISPGMLSEARTNAREQGVSNASFSHTATGTFDLIHSHIVLQHISPKRGMRIIADLASKVEPGGMLVLQVPYYRHAPAWRKLVTVTKRQLPLINRIINFGIGRGFSYPTMTMYCYSIPEVFTILRQAGIEDVRITLDPLEKGYAGATLYGEKRRIQPLTS